MARLGDLFSGMLGKGRGASSPASSHPVANRERAANLRLLERFAHDRVSLLVFRPCAHAPSFCWDVEETALAVDEASARRTGMPSWKQLPGGGPNALPECDCGFEPLKPGPGARPPLAPPKDILTGPGGVETAQQIFFQKITRNPVAYAKKLVRYASQHGFGELVLATPADLVGQKIPDTRLGKTVFGPEARLEDVLLALLSREGRIGSRAQLKELLTATLASKHWAVAPDGQLRFTHPQKTWVALVDPTTGLVTEFRPF
jgi:hypothetical protein